MIIKKLSSFIFTLLAKVSLKNPKARIKANGFTLLTKHTKIGSNLHFNGLRILGKGEVYIGNNFHSGFGCLILTGNHNYKGNKLPYDEVTVYKKVVIEDNVWLGIKVVILPGVTIGEGAIIQACSVVVSDIPKYSIAGGNPATPFLKRNLNHYNELKKKKCFI